MKAKHKHIAILVPDGVGIKNYLYSDLFKNYEGKLTLLHSFEDNTIEYIKSHLSLDETIKLPLYIEGIREKFLRELIHKSRLHYNAKIADNLTILKFWKSNHKTFKLKVFYFFISLISLSTRNYSIILILEKMYKKRLTRHKQFNEINNILTDKNIDTLFCTHQRAVNAPLFFHVAKSLIIKTVTVIYSWDNLPKARLALRADSYLVWSPHMKKEMKIFYPEISQSTIHITGTPQFEFFENQENILEKDYFFEKYGLDSKKKLICFSGDDTKTSPYDPEYLNDIATAFVANNIDKECQIILRRCPVDISGRFEDVVNKFPGLIIEIEPLWNYDISEFAAVYPLFDDVKLLVSLAYYADVVVNVGSTMAFDFGMFNKPCIYLDYAPEKSNEWNTKIIYQFQHFRTMKDQKSVIWLKKKEDIITIYKLAISNPDIKINTWFNHINANQGIASKKIKEYL